MTNAMLIIFLYLHSLPNWYCTFPPNRLVPLKESCARALPPPCRSGPDHQGAVRLLSVMQALTHDVS